MIKDLLLPTPPRMWRRRAGGQLKTWATAIKAGPGTALFGYARRKKDWVKVFREIAQDRRARSVSAQNVGISIGDAG